MILSFLRNRSVQVLIVTALYLISAPSLPLVFSEILYTLSTLIKDLLLWALPLSVAVFIASSIGSFGKKAPLFILALALFEITSNFISVWYGYGAAYLTSSLTVPTHEVETSQALSPLFRFPFGRPSWWSVEKGALAGFFLGLLRAYSKKTRFIKALAGLTSKVEFLFTQVFARTIPLFVVGFVAQMSASNLFSGAASSYLRLLEALLLFLCLYLIFLFACAAGFSFKKTFKALQNLLPAGGLALTSGCSLSTMPWTIEGAAKNMKNPALAKAIIPATTNIQQIGDIVTNTFLCFLIYRHFYGVSPDPMMWLTFSGVYVLARFGGAAVIGGVIFLMIPLYETYLHFNAEMIGLILALNIVLDPIVTSLNVMANGALCSVFEKLWGSLSHKESLDSP